ncbi:hypothetical protein DWB61_10275 [Ancylomarina euxinus]|uniref:Porin n=1 Tax=Ancylomarina euxinus TaxID=2283627 RepID=A0A425Y0L9_9BACT|nr:hypothetical protein [Ancylomarina euxinus]MCZ4695213.1 hypothetical protein [Ancylomarina euxinus]MUP15410.1 hypothetical protein [Ancylomarina euxinus]RRG21120.1 hypothetical protein DWB61_10275 [Ancylomarina euxinus]
MKKGLLLLMAIAFVFGLKAQEVKDEYKSIGTTILERVKDERLSIGGYGEIHYNQQVSGQTRYNGNMDVHRMVMFFGYQFNDKTSFVTELEFEHVSEVYVEQAFLNYNVRPNTALRAGLMLVPMGIVNEYHEPTTFNGVERPSVDQKIIPTTWREIGFGINGRLANAPLKYQMYIMNGFNGYDGSSKLRASDGVRKGRQKGAESTFTSPSLSAKVDYYGVKGLNLGLSAYFGKTQSSAFDGLDKDDSIAENFADSTRVGISMFGLDFRYKFDALQLKGQYIHSFLNNVDEYNKVADGADLGKQMMGYYVEAGYDLLHGKEQALIPFVRYENYNTQHKMASGEMANKANDRQDLVVGLSYHLAKGAVVKADYQYSKNGNDDKAYFLNFGVGVWF